MKGTNIRCGDIGTELSEPLAFIYMDREVKIQTEMDKAVNPYWDCSRDIDIQIKGVNYNSSIPVSRTIFLNYQLNAEIALRRIIFLVKHN